MISHFQRLKSGDELMSCEVSLRQHLDIFSVSFNVDCETDIQLELTEFQCTDDVNMLGENTQTIRENTKILLEASKAIGLEVNPEKTKYIIMSRDQNIVRNGNINIGDLSFEEVEKFKYLGATVTNINDTREEIKRRINMGNACYYSVEKLLSSSLLSKNLKVRIYKTVILPVLLYGCETWTLTLREEHRLRVFENKHGVGVEFVRVLPETHAPTLANVFSECAPNDDVRVVGYNHRWGDLQSTYGQKTRASDFRENYDNIKAKKFFGALGQIVRDFIRIRWCAIWINKCKRQDLDETFKTRVTEYLYKNHRICSDHFRLSDFNNPNLKSQGLKRTAIPSLNLTAPSSENMGQSMMKEPRKSTKKRIRPSIEEATGSPIPDRNDDSPLPFNIATSVTFRMSSSQQFFKLLNIILLFLFFSSFECSKFCALEQDNAIDAINWSGRKIRKHLRNDAFQTWTNHTLRGKGVIVYSDLPTSNSWVSNRKGLSSSEWTNALKMSSNISAVRAIPGRTLSTTRCRHPDCSELETLGHVLGQCPKGELLINARHHRVRHALAISLKTLNWEIHEEVHCVSSDGSFRRADIIAINGRLKRALVLDPTIREDERKECNLIHCRPVRRCGLVVASSPPNPADRGSIPRLGQVAWCSEFENTIGYILEMNNDRESETNSTRKAENPHDKIVLRRVLDVKTACECSETRY
ncbi:hypothetical protein ANN_11662 [Periplaneta americana]|uniref:THAP-type domain-containing protein n=1 Tax=Periplaneta americana TaxID=6978 RepID=A0ABQ8T5N5_PERAM|nr:hypothetical protein ANN_11662 [Periplaneta americana]